MKYVLYESSHGLQLFSINDSELNIIKYHGEDFCTDDIKTFLEWICNSQTGFNHNYCYISIINGTQPDCMKNLDKTVIWNKEELKSIIQRIDKSTIDECNIEDSNGIKSKFYISNRNAINKEKQIFVYCSNYEINDIAKTPLKDTHNNSEDLKQENRMITQTEIVCEDKESPLHKYFSNRYRK